MSRTPIYKNRKYKEIVTVERKEENKQVKFEVKFNENELKTDSTYNDERFTKFKNLVSKAVENLQENLNRYTENKFLQDLYTCPEKIQSLKNEFKKQLNDLEKQKPLNRSGKKTIRELKKQLTSIRTFNEEAKKVAAEDFGIMTARTVNNAIASWRCLFCKSEQHDTPRYIASSIKDRWTGKNGLAHWEKKLTNLASFKREINEEEVLIVEKKVKAHRLNLVRIGTDAKKNLTNSAINDFVSAIGKARLDLGIDEKSCSPYARLGMMLLCCDVVTALRPEKMLHRLGGLESTTRKVGRKLNDVGMGIIFSAASVLCIGTLIGLLGVLMPVLYLPGMLLMLTATALATPCLMAGYGVSRLGGVVFAKGKSAGQRMFGTKKTKNKYMSCKKIKRGKFKDIPNDAD